MKMKNIILLLTALLLIAAGADAQRLVLVEEFTGENCGPCADENPRLDRLMKINTDKALLIRYQVPIPYAGPIYNQYKDHPMQRMDYYGCIFAPWGQVDGKVVGTGPYPAEVRAIRQASLDAAYAVSPPFDIKLDAMYSSGDSIILTVRITANSAFNQSSARLRLRIALLESLHFAVPPGDNREKDFEHVVRMMYPDALGTALSSSWTASQTETITIRGRIPAYIDKKNEVLTAAWVQDDNTKVIHQAGRSIPRSATGMPHAGLGSLTGIYLYPNPAGASAMLSAALGNSQELSFIVTDMAGRRVYSLPAQLFQRGDIRIIIPTEHLPPGLYAIHIIGPEARYALSLRVAH